MARREFTKAVREAALARSKERCEATGDFYRLPPGQRCGASLAHGVEFDHIQMEAHSHDASLENCAAVCIPCHRIKTHAHDIPRAAKARRQKSKHRSLNRPDRPFPKRVDPWGRNRRDNTKQVHEGEARESAFAKE